MDCSSQAPLSMGFPRQVYWSGLPFPPPEHLLNPGIEPTASALAGGFFTTGPSEKTLSILTVLPFLGAHINSSRQYAAFDIHSCCCMYHWFTLLSAESYSTGWLEQSAFFHFRGHLGYFQFGVIMNKAAVNLYIQVFAGTQVSFLLSECLGVGLLDCLESVCVQHRQALGPVAPALLTSAWYCPETDSKRSLKQLLMMSRVCFVFWKQGFCGL